MYKEIEIENYGKLVVTRNELFGGINISLNGISFFKASKRVYKCHYTDDEEIRAVIEGNSFSGLSLKVLDNTIELTAPITWYGFVVSLMPLIFSLVFGNMPSAAKNGFYVLGGAFGGLLAGLALGIGFYIDTTLSIKKSKKFLFILLTSVITIALLMIFGVIIVKILKK